MDNLEIAKALFGNSSGTVSNSKSGGQTTTAYGIATGDSENGLVRVNLGGETTSLDDDQTLEVETTFAVFEGDEVIVSLIGADGTGKAPVVIGVVGRGDQQQTEIDSVINYVWNDESGLHVSTEERSVQGANILLDSDSLDIRYGDSNSESDQKVYASFGREVTVGSRRSGSTVGQYSQVYGAQCISSGQYSHADGFYCEATGDYSHAEGAVSKATGNYSHAEGLSCQATAIEAHAEGNNTVASAQGAHSEGHYTTASGAEAHSEGIKTVASGNQSHAEGVETIASSPFQHVQGKYNVEDVSWKYADIIGNGDYYGSDPDPTRSNAYNMDWNGNAEFQGEVYVGGCKPNGETPYPVVRYNTANAKSEYYDGSAWTQVPGSGGGGGPWATLWENNMSGSAFQAQTVSLDLSDYKVIAITLKPQHSTDNSYNIVQFAIVGSTTIVYVENIGSTAYSYKRTVTVDANGVTFSTGYRNTNGNASANYCIPMAIYGVC